jgi:hypothetical protein
VRLAAVLFGLLAVPWLSVGVAADSWQPEDGIPALDAGSRASEPVVVAPAEAEPGDLVRVLVRGTPLPNRIELRSGSVPVTATTRIDVNSGGVISVGAFLLGVDSTVSPGAYELVGIAVGEDPAFRRPFRVTEREFRREEIPLNRDLTSLRDDYDPRKEEERRILTDLILSRDPAAMFHPGTLQWPLPPDTRRTSYYGDRRTYLYANGERAGAIHVGLDLASPVGTPVASSGNGVVRMARSRIVTGLTVVIEHLPGVYSLYYHLDELTVAEGDEVSAGESIGTVGSTGLATGPHLHWEVRVAGVAVSPERATRGPLLLDWPIGGALRRPGSTQ